MSLNKSACRAVLFASASLVAAGFAAMLAPTAAMAQATCTSGTAITDNGTNAVTIAAGDPNNPGITCAYTGTAATVSLADSTTVSTLAPGGGINLTATGSSAINWNSASSSVAGGAETNGPVIEALSNSGAIDIAAGAVFGSDATVTHGIRAVSTGGGAVSVNAGYASATSATGDGVTAGGSAAIEAISTGGNGAVSVTASVDGRLYGIRAQASGSGALTINTNGANVDSAAGLAGIQATTGTGLLTINGVAFGGAGTGVLINAGGDVVFTGTGTGAQYGIDIANVAAGTTTTLNLTGARSVFGGVNGSTSGDIAPIRAQGAGTLLVNVVGAQEGMNFNFAGMTTPVEVVVRDGGAWVPATGATNFATGNFSIEIEDAAAMIVGMYDSDGTAETPTVLTFAPGISLNNAGYILVGPDNISTSWRPRTHEAELRMVGLDEFRHSGTILLGSVGYPGQGETIQEAKIEATDGWYDDLLVFEDGTWIGEGGRIVFDIDTNRTQDNCTRAAVTYDFSAADCLRIVDSTVEGVTYINLDQILAADRGRLTQEIMETGILIVETPGSTVTAENFALDPNMRGYNADTGSLDKGLYQHVLLFDEAASEFRLFGTLTGAAYQLPMAATAAHGLWRLSTGSWFDRQADLRGGIEDGTGGGVWLRASGEQTDRDVISVSTLGGLPYALDNTHQVNTYAITGGADLVSAHGETLAYVVGVMGGYAHTEIEYDASSNIQAMDGWTAGVYASLVSGDLFVDAAINANNVIADTDAPGFDFFPEGTILSSRMISVGGQVEAGWRLPIGEGLFAEPLASVSYVRSKMEDLDIRPDDTSRPGLLVSYDDPTSLRAGLGGRVGMDQDFGSVRTQFTVLGRVWNEFEGENTASIHNLAFPTDPDIAVVDDFSGQFNELALGASVYSAGGVVSGFLNLGGKFGDDYQAKTGSVGVRVAW